MDIRKIGVIGLIAWGVAFGVRAGTPDAGFQTEQAKAHYLKGVEYGDKEIWAAAILELNQARQLEPGNPEILTELGIAYGERKQWKEALAFLRKAVMIAPGSVRAHYNLALTLDRADPGKGAGAIEYRKTLKLDPRHVDSLINLGIDIGDQNPAQARQFFTRAIELAPKNANAHLNLALLLKRDDAESASSAEFRRTIELNPDLVEARRQLAALLMSEQQWEKAIEQCREIMKREPGDAATQYTLGQAMIRNGETEGGKQELERAQAMRKRAQEEQEAQELQNEGVRDLSTGKAPDALKALTSAVRLDGSSANHMYLGLALVESGEVKSGVGELATAVDLDPKNARAHLNLGSVYLQNGQEFLAKSEFEKALEIDPWFPEAHNNLGLILSKSDRTEEAEQHFRLAAELDPGYLEAIFNLGLSLRALNRPDEALRVLRRAAELAPRNAHVQYALGQALKENGDLAGARKALDTAAALERQNQ